MASKGMIFLEAGNKIIEEAMTELLTGQRKDQGLFELNIPDFDDVYFKLIAEGSSIHLHIRVPNYAQLASGGLDRHLQNELGSLRASPERGFDVSIAVDANRLPLPQADVITKFAQLRSTVQGAPLVTAFTELASKRPDAAPSTALSRYDYRAGESIFVVPQKDRVVVVLQLDFGDDTDLAMARIFLQEFVETQRSVSAAPVCSYSRAPPHELRELRLPVRRPVLRRTAQGEVTEDGTAGYISFALFPSHVATGEKRAKAAGQILGFRSYLHYHIKATKTYLHMRMRMRVSSLMQVLNRAIPEVETEKKTMSGKTFKRAVP